LKREFHKIKMDVKQACRILEIPLSALKRDDKQSFLKRKYHLLALQRHPDKKPDSEGFHELKDAYDFLQEYKSEDRAWLAKLFGECEKQISLFLEEISCAKFCMVYNLLTRYKHLFQLSDAFYENMEKKKIYWFAQGDLKKRRLYDSLRNEYVISDPEKKASYRTTVVPEWDLEYEVEEVLEDDLEEMNDTMILRPALDDIWDHNVYRYNLHHETYLIPLWHKEVMYENLTVTIIPQIPLMYWIDEYNNLHQKAEYTVGELWSFAEEEKCMEIYFGKKRFLFYPHQLTFQKYQTWTWEKQGISRIQENIYDISRLADVILHICLT